MTFAHPWLLGALVLVPAALAFWWWGMARGRNATTALSRQRPARPPYAAAVLLAVAASAAIVGAAQPRWGTRDSFIPRTGAQLIFVVDVSRSMAVEDVAPNRLVVAREAIANSLTRLGGDRVGLVIFGGDSRLRFPLTTDFEAASRVVRSLEPGQVLVDGGSSASSGLDIALDAFDDTVDAGRLIVLVTDGDDLGADPASVAERVRASGADLIVVGAGTAEGGTIPVYDLSSRTTIEKLDAEGAPIISGLNEPFLRALATAAGGRYLGSDPAALPGAVEGRVETLKRSRIEQQAATLPVERHQWFAAAAIGFVVLASVAERIHLPSRRKAGGAAALLATGLLFGSCATQAHDLNEGGLTAYEAGEFARAAELFVEAQAEEPQDPSISLNLAAALHADGRYEEANIAARRALVSQSAGTRARAHASIGHHRFAVDDLPGALSAFRQALIEDPGDEASRHDYEVVLRLLTPPPPEEGEEPGATPTPSTTPMPGQPGATPEPGEGGEGGEQPGGTPDPNAPPAPGDSGPGEGGEAPGQPGGQRPSTPADIEAELERLDDAIAELVEDAGDDPSATEAIQILELLEERARIAAIRDALAGGGDPNDY